jgi:GGDEF domain-containing protein
MSAVPVRLADLLRPRPTGFGAYVVGVVLLGNALLGYGIAVRVPAVRETVDGTFVLLAVLLVAAEVRPLSVQRRGGARDSISLSSAFACALLLHHDWSLVAAVLAVGSLLDDRQAGSAWWKAAFNAGQYVLCLVAASAVLGLSGQDGVAGDAQPPLLLSLLSCAVFFLVNTTLPGIAIALQEGSPVLRSLRDDLPLQWSVNGVVVAMAPLVVAVANDSLWLVGLLVVPVLAVHRGAVSALEREHMTLHDPLTGLPNQIAFQQRLVEQLEAATDGEHVAVLVLALDHMDDVSNTLGPSAAEELLEQVARRLRTTVPEGAVLARSSAAASPSRSPGCARRGRPAPAPRRCSRSSATRTTSSSRPSPCAPASA